MEQRKYVRLLALKIALCAMTIGVAAAAVPVPGGEISIAEASWYGMKLGHLIIGTVAAGVTIFFMPQFSGLELGRTIVSGMFCALIGTPLFSAIVNFLTKRYLGVELPAVELFFAAAFGIGGVFIIPLGMSSWDSFRRDPLGTIGRVIDRIRNRQTGGGQ